MGIYRGTRFDDHIFGDLKSDTMFGLGGNDSLSGWNGSDTIDGGNGSDRITGDAGDDLLYGGNGNDRLFGGSNDDILRGGTGDDRLYGGRSYDTLIGGPGDDTLAGGSGQDTFVFSGNVSHDVILDYQPGTDLLNLTEKLAEPFPNEEGDLVTEVSGFVFDTNEDGKLTSLDEHITWADNVLTLHAPSGLDIEIHSALASFTYIMSSEVI